jgi:hypothetical protein
MSKRGKLDDLVPPRVVSEREAAYYLGRSETSFQAQKEALERQGLPKVDPVTGGSAQGVDLSKEGVARLDISVRNYIRALARRHAHEDHRAEQAFESQQ